jgi:hypothetical protein
MEVGEDRDCIRDERRTLTNDTLSKHLFVAEEGNVTCENVVFERAVQVRGKETWN